MTGFQIFLCILGGIIAFFVLVLSVPVHVSLHYGDKIYLTVRYLFIKLNLLPLGEKKEKKPRIGAALLIVLLLAAAGWQLHSLQDQVAAAQAEKARYQTEVETLRQENDALAADIAEGATNEKMEEIARKELGVVTPGEYVFSHRGN